MSVSPPGADITWVARQVRDMSIFLFLRITARCELLETVKHSSSILDFEGANRRGGAMRLLDVTSNSSRTEPLYPERPARLWRLSRASPLEIEDALSMRQDERKSLLLLEWDRWLQTQPIDPTASTAKETLKFFCELQDRRSPLLDFRPRRHDRWRVIHALLLNEGRVSD